MVQILEREIAQTIIKIERPSEEEIIIAAFKQSAVKHRVGDHKIDLVDIYGHIVEILFLKRKKLLKLI